MALLLAAVLLAGLAVVLLRVQEAPEQASSASPATAPVPESPGAPETPALQSLAAAWQRPLFNPDREPDAQGISASSGPDLSTFLLTGIVIEGDHRVAMFKQKGGASLTLREGATLKDGWRIRRIDPRRVELHNNSESRVLQLLTPRLPSAPAPARARSASP
ncbi:hypothetical protein PS627_04291 [Pseudomonas fluorescens]|uniref:SctD/MshK family protein n=1 Tax=Pseudomonas fluorescens TaxID=294 RepID=UPI00125396A4|nr:hypothetical protein [Pseudomonas fluorescens]CAG8871111.1 hypothetical protein PS627_04291 [Pseudomonas fluorescens]VVP93562.1 hypothetical protein PS910_03117 [Pseudomonas fluorescens]